MLGDAFFLSFAGSAPDWDRSFTNPHWLAAAQTVADVPALLQRAWDQSRQGAWVVVALAYEAAPAFDPGLRVHAPGKAPLAFAAAYAAPTGDGCPEPTPSGTFTATPWRPLISRERYDRALVALRENIRQGEVYQVNYTFPLACRFSGDPATWFAALAREQGAAYSCRLDLGGRRLLSFSPELFFERRGETVVTRPMKGTMPRGGTPAADAAMAEKLRVCPKNRAENRMITDLLRNDLGRVARTGSVAVPELFTVEPLGPAWQMTSTVTARVPRETGLFPLLTALFPCGSITGAPKRSAMRLIRRLEPHPRGFYTGAIGQIAPGGDATFAVAIRTVECDSQTGLCRFGVGGGITYDSDARGEYEECRTKAAFLRQAAPFELLETLLLAHGRFAFLPEHCARLAGSAAFSGYAHDPAVIERALAAVRLARPTGRHRVRLLLARDGHPRTEAFPLGPRGTAPLRLGWASRPVTADDPALRHKTTRRERYDRALAEHPDCDDVLLINADGEVTESCRANLVAALDGRLVTPALACGLLPGTYRERLLARGRLVEARLRPEDLARASRLWCINSVRLWMPAVLATPDPAAASAPSTGQARFATTAP